jgi:outer membrane biosynthesis protein TonB
MRREDVRLIIAILISAVLHLVAAGVWKYREVVLRFHPLARLASVLTTPREAANKPAAAQIPTITFVELPAEPPPPPKPPEPPPRTFIETDNTQVTGEKPKDAQFYSDRSTVAANPTNPTGKTGDTPFLDGKQTKIVSTENVVPGPPPAPAPKPSPPQPPAPKPTPPPVVAKPVEPKPKEPEKPVADAGLKIVEEKKVAQATPVLPKPAPAPAPAPAPVPSPMPVGGGATREIAATKSRMTAIGVSRSGVAAFNVAESPFGAYDKEIIRAVQSRWYGLIQQNALYERAGTVRLRFELLADGSVQNLKIAENSAGEILGLFCEKAIVDSAPFKPLTEQLRALIGDDPREVNFTFYY